MKYFSAEGWTEVMTLKRFGKIVFGRGRTSPRQEGAGGALPAKSDNRAIRRFARRAGLWNKRQERDLVGFWRAAAASRAATPARPGRSNWQRLAWAPLLLAGVVVGIMIRPIASADNATPAGTAVADSGNKRAERDVAPPSPTKTPKPGMAARQPEAQTSGLKIAVRSPEAQKSRPDVAASLPEPPMSKPDTTARQPDAQQPPSTAAAPLSELQKAEIAAPLPEAPKAKADVAARQPEPQTSGLNTAPSPLQVQKSKPDVVASLPEMQRPEAEAAARQPEAQTAKHESNHVAVPQLVLSADVAKKIGQKIWLNETGGRTDAITSWNPNEQFASLGIGHFIWFPLGKWLPFEESFPGMVEFLRKEHARLPPWLDKPEVPASPWTSREEFKRDFNSPEMRELRQFLLATMAEQTQFMVARAQGAMDKILKNTPDSADRAHIVTQFSRVVRASEDLYPLIDYINFKGEGTNPKETAPDKQTGTPQGWGLKQVLLRMSGTSGDPKIVLAEYADAVQQVLQQRVRNLPSNRIWEAGWLRRVDTYRRPLADMEANPMPAQNEGLPARAAR